MAHTIRNKKQLLSRVRRIKGQTEALENALSEEAECVAILQQIAAVRGAVNGLMGEVLESHIREHLVAESMPPRQREQDVEQLVRVLRSYLK